MKKLAAIFSFLTFLGASSPASADIVINLPDKGYKSIGNFISNMFTIALSIGVLLVMIMLIWGAFDWIMSGGEKDAVGKARGRIINSLIGLAVMAVAFALAKLAGQIAGFGDITNLVIPTPNPNAS